MRKFLRVFARLAPAAAALALCSSAQAATYAWGITKSIDPGDAAFTLAQGESHSVDYNLLVVNALASGDPADGSETATLTDTISCPAGFTCTRVGTTTFPLTVAAADGSFKNIGAGQISKNQSLGFTMGDDTGMTYEDMKNKVMGELKKVFRPELLNRIDEVIVFHKLTKEEILIIVDIQMKRVREQMATHEVAIELTDEAKELLVEKGYDPAMGARPLRRAIQRVIEDPLADFVLGRTLEPGSTILVARKGDTDEVDMTVIPGEVTPEKVLVPPEEPIASGDEPESDED